MSKFHTLKVSDVVKETADAVSVAFEVPANLKSEYKFKQGQYLTLKLKVNGEELRRSYSICTGVDDNDLRVAIKKVKDGKGSSFINDNIKVGDSIEVMIPMGNFFTEMNANNAKNYVLFAGGSGVTPMMSILKTVLKSEPKSTVTLFYGNNDEASIIFKKQIDFIVQSNADRVKVYHILNVPPANHPVLLTGMMTKEKTLGLIENYVGLNNDNEFFICGPTPMMDNVKAALQEAKAPENKVHIEYFTSPVSEEEVKPSANAVSGAQATIMIDGDEHAVTMQENETVLEAALRIGLDAPYACQGGSCCTCRALLENGKVDMTVNYALSASEVKSGYILTCQSRPTTSTVVVNYDKGL